MIHSISINPSYFMALPEYIIKSFENEFFEMWETYDVEFLKPIFDSKLFYGKDSLFGFNNNITCYNRIRYWYKTKQGDVLACIGETLEECRELRNIWLKINEEFKDVR